MTLTGKNNLFSSSFSFEGLTRQKKAGEPIFLFESGDFYDSFRFILNNDNFVIQAETQKEDQNLLTFGEILGIGDESLSVIIRLFKEFAIEKTKEQINSGGIF